MKKLFTLILCTFATLVQAEVVEFAGGVDTGHRTVITVPSSPSDTLLLDSTNNTYYSAVNNPTYKSVSVVKKNADGTTSVGGASIAFGYLTLDANTTDENFDILTAGDWSMNYTYLVLKNSAANSTSNLNVNVNKFTFASGSQNQYIDFESGRYTVNTKSTSKFNTTDAKYKARINVKTGASISWTGAGLEMGTNSELNLDGSFKMSKNISFASSSKININSGGVYNQTSATFTLASGATATVKAGGNFTFAEGSNFNLNGTLNSAVALVLRTGTSTGVLNQTAGNITISRPFELNSGANWTVFEKLILQSTSNETKKIAKFVVNEGANIVLKDKSTGAGEQGRIIFSSNNNLVLNKANAFTDQDGNNVQLVTVAGSKNNMLTINADQYFTSLYTNKADLDIIMGEGVTLAFEVAYTTTDAYLNIYNFQENTISFGGMNESYSSLESINLYGATKDDYLGKATIKDGYLSVLLPPSVPEPAEWAMVLGALALGLAVYRRRK